MRSHNVREVVAAGGCAVNAWMSTDSPYLAEVLSHAGFDSVTVDAQHGMFGPDTIVRLLQAISAGPATPMVRPTSVDAAEIGWLLDAGGVRNYRSQCRHPGPRPAIGQSLPIPTGRSSFLRPLTRSALRRHRLPCRG